MGKPYLTLVSLHHLALLGLSCVIALISETAFATGGAVFGWGNNTYGVLDIPAGLTNAVAVAATDAISVALRANGTVLVWGGNNTYGERNVPPQARNVVAIANGGLHCFALRQDGSLVQWGATNGGIPLSVTGVVAIATGGAHQLALRKDGQLLAWGANNYGQCNVPFEATNVVAIAAGYTHSLALRKDGQLLAWGDDAGHQTEVPPDATNVVGIAAGGEVNLALRADGHLLAWGSDWGGNLTVPSSATNIVSLAVGVMDSYVVRADGAALAWGRDDEGQLDIPAALSPAFTISVNQYTALGLRVVGGVSLLWQPDDRTVSAGDTVVFNSPAIGQVPLSYQWRYNGSPLPGETSPVLLLPGVQATNAGSYDLVVLNGFNSVTSRLATLAVQPAAPTITRQPTNCTVSPGDTATFAGWAKGTLPLHCQWQRNDADLPGQTNAVLCLANVTFASSGVYRLVVTNDFGQAITAEARLEVGLVFAWGTNQYHLLDALPPGLTNVVAIAAGDTHALALKPDGTIIGWGDNGYNECDSWPDVTNVTAIAAGHQYSLALRGDGTVRPWGGRRCRTRGCHQRRRNFRRV